MQTPSHTLLSCKCFSWPKAWKLQVNALYRTDNRQNSHTWKEKSAFQGFYRNQRKACFQHFIKRKGLFSTSRCKPFTEIFRDKTDRILLHYFCQADQIKLPGHKVHRGMQKTLITSWEGSNFLERNWGNGEKEKAMQSEALRRQKAMMQCILRMTTLIYSGIEFDQNMPHFIVHT